MAHIGSNIARIRGFKRLTQKQIASKLKMRQQDYSKIENSETIDDDMLELISAALDIPSEIIKQLDNNSVISYNQQGGNTGSIFYQVNPMEKLIEVYERLLKEKDAVITQKDKLIEMYKKGK